MIIDLLLINKRKETFSKSVLGPFEIFKNWCYLSSMFCALQNCIRRYVNVDLDCHFSSVGVIPNSPVILIYWPSKAVVLTYRKFPKYSDTQNICCNHSKIWTMWLYSRSSLFWVCSVCPGISVWKLRIITVVLSFIALWPLSLYNIVAGHFGFHLFCVILLSGTSVVVPYCYLFLLSVFILWFIYYMSDYMSDIF